MKAYWVWAIAMAGGTAAHAGEPVVAVYLHDTAHGVDRVPVALARQQATEMFQAIGVAVEWRFGDVRRAAADSAFPPIVIQLDATAEGSFSSRALAFALPFASSGTRIHVFLDRVADLTSGHLSAPVLAHVLAHEITHVLEGVDRHSQEGVMKARWEFDDLQRMKCRPLNFSAWDVELIHAGLKARVARPPVTE